MTQFLVLTFCKLIGLKQRYNHWQNLLGPTRTILAAQSNAELTSRVSGGCGLHTQDKNAGDNQHDRQRKGYPVRPELSCPQHLLGQAEMEQQSTREEGQGKNLLLSLSRRCDGCGSTWAEPPPSNTAGHPKENICALGEAPVTTLCFQLAAQRGEAALAPLSGEETSLGEKGILCLLMHSSPGLAPAR